MEEVVDQSRGDHDALRVREALSVYPRQDSESLLTWVDCSTDNTPERVPGGLVEPVPELVETFIDEDSRRSVVEPARANVISTSCLA